MAVVFAEPVPIAVPTAPVTFEATSHHCAPASADPQLFGAISYVLPPEMRNTNPPPGPVDPSAYPGVTEPDVLDALEVPAEFVAVTVNV